MTISIDVSFAYSGDQPTDVLLQFEAAAIPEQQILSCDTKLGDAEHIARIPAQDDIGERIWVRSEGRFEIDYKAEVEVQRLIADVSELCQLDTHDLPGESVQYLFDSRYCQADRMQSFVEDEFGELSGGKRVMAMHNWISSHFSYVPGASNANTTAVDSFIERRGICRDYAHVMVTLARASSIPARFVSCFAPGVEPPDFHAVAEVFLEDQSTPGGGAWYLVDATGMGTASDIVKIGVGRDAADVSFMTSFGLTEFIEKTVTVSQS
ncbi:transglutaminase-like domain-containing protein [Qipengyuania atrilutea]|uniref:Transglutaminase family protein n=1 Tax=Qipengyuania atrilutea TaxID=2744473 RepID=A0A850H466_9SPHN|nr:transglutaminase family protein [Actirhodobacter atriluteus]NVD44982.1 transglutaminase family protein [Actirhodobacter atriluteus]